MRCKRSRVIPPDASVGARPATCFTAAASSRSPRLSSRSRSAPAASASSICSGVLTSASTRRRGEAAALARRTASPTPPAAAAWLSFTRIPSNSAPRWFPPPPARTAAFSSARIPGLVLRVSSRRVRVPRSAWAYRWVSVAMPQRRCRRFSAVRSALSNPRRRPRTRSTPAPAAAASPSPSKGASSQSASSARKTRAAAETPETISGSLATTSAVPRACGGTQASALRSPGPTSSSSASSMRRPTASPGRPRSSGTATGRGFIRSRRAMNSVAPPYRRRLPPRAASLACLLAAALLLALGGAAARFRGRAPGRLLRLGLAARLGGRLPGALAASGCLLRRALRPGRLGRLGQPLLQLGRVLRHLLQLLLGALHAGLQHVGGLFHQSAGEVLHPGKRLRRGALAASARRGRARLAALSGRRRREHRDAGAFPDEEPRPRTDGKGRRRAGDRRAERRGEAAGDGEGRGQAAGAVDQASQAVPAEARGEEGSRTRQGRPEGGRQGGRQVQAEEGDPARGREIEPPLRQGQEEGRRQEGRQGSPLAAVAAADRAALRCSWRGVSG